MNLAQRSDESLALVLLPGLDGTGDLFRELVAELQPQITPIVLDYPTDALLGYDALESLVRKRLPVNRPICLLAESFSGPIGFAIAADPPVQLRGLVLCASFARFPTLARGALATLVRLVSPRLAPTWLLSAILMGDDATPARREALARALSRVDADVLRYRALRALAVDVRALAERIGLPGLDIRASRDRVVATRAARQIAKARCYQRVDVAGPHFLAQTQAPRIARAITGFIGQIEGRVS